MNVNVNVLKMKWNKNDCCSLQAAELCQKQLQFGCLLFVVIELSLFEHLFLSEFGWLMSTSSQLKTKGC